MNRPPLHIAFPFSALLALAATVLLCWWVGRFLEARRKRPTLVGRITGAKFAALLREEGIGVQVNSRVAVTVYRYLREIQEIAVPPLPEDDLVWDLGLTETQVEDTVADLTRRLHPSVTLNLLTKLPRTVEDLAILLQNTPNEASASVKQAA